MPLVHCRTCGKQISDQAVACPDCGAPQDTKRKSSGSAAWILIPLLIIIAGAFLYINKDMFNSTKIIIPEGAYVLEKSPDKGLLRVLEVASSNIRGLGSQITVYGDSLVLSTGAISNVLGSLDGGSTKFKLQKTNTDNEFLLYLNNNPVPLELTDTKELKITINSITLMYQKQ